MKISKSLKQLFTHIALYFTVVIFWAAIEITGPILFNFEDGFRLVDIVRVGFHALFHAGIIAGILSLLGRRSFITMIGLTIVYAIVAYANLLYFRSFGICFPFNMMFEFQQLNGITDSIISLVRWYDVSFIIIIATAIYLYIKLKDRLSFSVKRHLCIITIYITITAIPVYGILHTLKWSIDNMHKSIHLNYAMSPIKNYRAFGLLPSLSYQFWNTDSATELSEAQQKDIKTLLDANIAYTNNNLAPKKNLVILLMEAMSTSCIHSDYMPTLNSLCNSKTTLYCPNIKQLTQGAMSIGGQFVVMSGLHGLRNAIFVADFPENTYPSIALDMIKRDCNCYTSSIISSQTNFWQQDIVNQQLSLHNLFGIDGIKNTIPNPHYNKHNWIDDKTLFEFAALKIKELHQSFCIILVPSNMHSEWTEDANIVCDATFAHIQDPKLHEYMRRAHHLDNQIALLINELKANGLFDDTLIVVTSDHKPSDVYCSDAMRQELSPYIPAIFINTGADWTEHNERNKDVVFCHSQVYPTMLQLMGLKPEKYAGLFPPMTNIEATQEYDFDNCDYATTTDEKLKQIYDLEELMIRSSYFGTLQK